ncbi:MAG: hypothetical protein AB1511_03040 [Deinococcota bacterium]
MILLPERLRSRLAAVHRVVAPVDVGAGQAALVVWAAGQGLAVTREPPGVETERWLWWPRSREALASWAREAQGGQRTFRLS